MTDDLDTLRPEVRAAMEAMDADVQTLEWLCIRAELLRLVDENARLNKIESLATEQRLQMEDAELYLMDVSQPDDEDAPWCDRMKSAIELLVQDCNYAVGQKNKAEAELAAMKARIAGSSVVKIANYGDPFIVLPDHFTVPNSLKGKTVHLLVEE